MLFYRQTGTPVKKSGSPIRYSAKTALLYVGVTVFSVLACLLILPSTAAVHWDAAWKPKGFASLLPLLVESVALGICNTFIHSKQARLLTPILCTGTEILLHLLSLSGPLIGLLLIFFN